MKTRKGIIYFIAIALSVLLLPAIGVKAEEVYGAGDIERIYINSDTPAGSLNKDDYVPATVTVVHKDGAVEFSDVEAQVKLRGNSTSKAEKKPFKIKLSSKQELLGMDAGKKWNILANAFDKTLIRNSLAFDLSEKMGIKYICERRFVDLYYNDVLFGSYLITEPVETGTGRVEIDDAGDDFMLEIERERWEADVTYVETKSGVRFAVNAPEVPTDVQLANIKSFLGTLEDSLKTKDLSEYSKYIDVDSFVNYYIVCEIFKAVDFNYSSTRFHMQNGKMYAGPIWDVDLSSGNASKDFYGGYYKDGVSYKDLFCTQMKWYEYLMGSDEFVAKVNARMREMYPVIENMYKTNTVGTNQIDALLAVFKPSFERNYLSILEGGAGWSITKRYSTCDNPKGLEYSNHPATYMGNVEMLREWLSNRVPYLQNEWRKMAKDAGIYDAWDIDRIYINTDNPVGSLNKDDYVQATVTIVYKDGTVEFCDFDAQVKLRGNSTSKAEKRPFKIKLSSKQKLLGMDEGKKWNILANAFDKTLIRNSLAFDLSNKMGIRYICESRFVDLYYNNELFGSYLITEPVETGKGRVDIDEEGDDFMIEIERERWEDDVTYVNTKSGVRFAINAPEVPTDAQLDNINKFLANVETALKTKKISEYSKYIDVDSFVNYYIVCEIFKAVDFNYSSTRFHVQDGKMYAGPLWDVDLSSGNASKEFYKDYYKDGVSYKDLFCTQMKWYGYLIKSDEFVAKVNARMQEMYPVIENMYKTNAKGTNQIDVLIASFKPSFERNYLSILEGGAGWSLTKRYSICDNPKGLEYLNYPATYMENVTMLREWLSNRVPYLQNEWKSIKNNYVDLLTAKKKTYNSIKLEWYNIGLADGNEIYYKGAKGKYKLLKTITDSNVHEFVAKKLKPGIKYTFQIRSYMLNGTEKTYSDFTTVSKKLPLKSPKAKVKRVNKKATVTWKKIKGANGYVVYAKAGKGKFKKVATLKGYKKVKYIKKNCKLNKKYKFKVKAYVTFEGKKYLSK